MSHTASVLPREFLIRLRTLVRPAAYGAIVLALSGERPTTFRINTLKTKKIHIPFSLERIPWYQDAYILRSGDLRSLTGTPEYIDGKIYVQSLTSMMPPLILDPKPGEKILDMAAAPGSKTTQMAALMENRGEIVANDISRERSYRLKANLQSQGVTITKMIREDGRSLWQRYPEYFDKVLVDAPCSMEGRFNAHEPKTYQDWSLKKVKDLSHLQRWMLHSAISATKPSGVIVYATCTLSPEENEEVIDWILKKEKGAVVMEEMEQKWYAFDPAVLRWGNKRYDASIGKSVRIYPTYTMEGFYIAKLRKIRSTVPKMFRIQMGYNTPAAKVILRGKAGATAY